MGLSARKGVLIKDLDRPSKRLGGDPYLREKNARDLEKVRLRFLSDKDDWEKH